MTLEVAYLGTAHPDADWIAEVRCALDGWAAMGTTSPTSSVLGSGAIAAAEAVLSGLHSGRPALLLPSATYALRVGLEVLGVQAGDEVICAAIDWPAGFAAIRSLGATPVPVAVSKDTLTLDPAAAADARTELTRAVIACHLHGVCADVPAIGRLLPGVPVLEDAAQAFGSRLDGYLAGTMADAAVLSLGPGKQIDAGEGGVLLCDGAVRHDLAAAIACHPLRQLVGGLPPSTADKGGLAIRPHPMAAVLALHRLSAWRPVTAAFEHAKLTRLLADCPFVHPLADAARRRGCQPYVPVLVDSETAEPPTGVHWSHSGAQLLPGLSAQTQERTADLLARIRLVSCAD